jgi:hypothetical protein
MELEYYKEYFLEGFNAYHDIYCYNTEINDYFTTLISDEYYEDFTTIATDAVFVLPSPRD